MSDVAGEICLRAVSREYRPTSATRISALADVSLSIAAGEAVAVQGASGSGKSTLLHLIGGMDRVTSGSITVGSVEITGLSRGRLADYRRMVGFVFQDFNLLPTLSVRDNVLAPLLPYDTDFDRAERAAGLLELVGLGDRGAALPSELSGGQQQRVAIARALINRPGLLLADEPTGNLDPTTGGRVIELLMELHRESGTTLIIATHDPVIAGRCQRIVVLADGAQVDASPSSPESGG